MTKQWTAQEIDTRIQQSSIWLARAIVALLHRQTWEEQKNGATTVSNGMGFNASDARLLTSFGKQLERGFELSPKQEKIARWMMKKYVGQLTRIANARSNNTAK